jgi:hypothetical protein
MKEKELERLKAKGIVGAGLENAVIKEDLYYPS